MVLVLSQQFVSVQYNENELMDFDKMFVFDSDTI